MNGSITIDAALVSDWRERCHDALDAMRDDPETGRRIGQRLRDDATAAGDRLAELGSEVIFGFASFYGGDLAAAEDRLERTALRFQEVGDMRGVALCMFGILLNWRSRGMTREAYELGHSRMLPALPPYPTREAALSLNGMGVVAQECGYTDEAIRHFYSALDAARTLGLASRMAQITANIGEVFYVSGNAEDAEAMLTEARQLAQQSSERWLRPFVSTVLALSKLSLDKHEEAYQAIAEYVDDIERDATPDIANRVFCLSVAAYTLAMRDQLDEAENLCEIAMGLIDQFEEKQLKPYSWWVRGHLHHRRGRIPEAIAALNRAVDDIGKIGFVFMPLRAIRELTQIHAEQGNWQAAYLEQQRYQAMFERSQSQSTRVRLQTLHIKSELKEAETARRLAEQNAIERETILENSLVGIALLKADGCAHWANRAMLQMFGMGSGYVGMSLEPYYLSSEAYQSMRAEVTAAMRAGRPFETELQMRRADGTRFWAALSGRSVDPGDPSQGTVWAVMDITKRRQLEQDLSKSEEHHRQVVNNVTEGILVVQDSRVVFANPRVFELTGFAQETLFSVPFTDAIHPDDRALVIDRHLRRLRGELVEQYYQFRIANKRTGVDIWIELSAVLIEWEGRAATLSFMTDVTERRRLEESLKHSMEERMRLQTLQIQAELTEAELARRHAEETTRAKSMFLANMSHEIRTPMNAIIGMAHLALRTELSNKQRDYIDKIHNAGISLLGIINDILDFSKIEAGKLDMERIEFDLEDVLDNVSAVTAGRAHEKGLEYLFRTAPDMPHRLIGDPLRLGQVLINLVNNAVKFTDAGEVYLSCRPRTVGGGRIELEFMVRDTGIGMDPEQVAKLFQAFSQADESTTRRYGGTGLGLSIAKEMVELMDGAIRLESTPGLGTTIRFSAWFGLADTQQPRRVVPDAINGMRVLVVDDNPVARTVLAESLSTLPVEIDQACDGEEALAAIRGSDRERPYGVIFTDLRMPGIDGIDLIGQVKRDPALQAPPRLVLVSAYGREEVRYREHGAFADGFLMKPVSASVLVDTMVGLFAPVPAVAAADGVAPPRFRELSVLLVEDNEINQQIAVELMEAAGITVRVAANGRIALDLLQASDPDHYGLVFMDVQMPEMDGHEATRRIRADARFASLPVIAMTAHAMVEERERCFASGMDGHLAKPIDPDQLYQAIARWCPRHAGAAAVPPADEAKVVYGLEIEGVDVQDGLKRMLGNRGFYLQMLARFRDGQHDAVAAIRAALLHAEAGSQATARAEAERLTHTLKGVAGQLGATVVHGLAGTLEHDIHCGAGNAVLLPQLDRLDGVMGRLMQALVTVLPDKAQAEAVAAPGVDRPSAQELIRRFARLLQDYDGEAIDLLGEADAMLAAALGSETHKRIARAARHFDFDTALAALDAGARAAGYDIAKRSEEQAE